jgi:cysteine dioxygenase
VAPGGAFLRYIGPVLTLSDTLLSLLADLDAYPARIPLDRLAAHLEAARIGFEDVASVACFGERTYRRNLLHAGPAYQALVLCWRNGQRSPIHDHRGSSCGVRVLRGVATETRFRVSANGMVLATHSRELDEGCVCASEDADIHQMSNLQAGDADLVTLHVYSPPLLRMGTYSLTERTVGEFVDPVFENCDGDGI